MSGRGAPTDAALREQVEFESRQKAMKKERIRKVAADNPTLPLSALSERFNESEQQISRIIGGCSIERRDANWSIPRSVSCKLEPCEFNAWKRRA